MFEKGRDGGLVTLVENPLADAPGGDEVGVLQHREMGGDGGLGEAARIVDLAGADAQFVGVILVGEVFGGVFELGEDFAAHRIGERFQRVVDVIGGGLHRHIPIYVSAFHDG